MSGAYRWSGSIQVGPMLQFPVSAKGAVKEQKVAFNLHHVDCGGRLNLGNSICPACDRAVEKEEVVKGYNGKPGIDTDYLKSLEQQRSELLEVEAFVDASEIDPRFYAKSYTVTPGKGGEKAYAMLATVLAKKKKVAVGSVVMGGSENIVVLRPKGKVLSMELMYWPAEVLSDDEAVYAVEDVKLSAKEVGLGETLIGLMGGAFDPAKYVNKLHEERMQYLDAFLADKAPTPLAAPRKAKAATTDLAAALEASAAALREAKPASKVA